jgi:RNA polymerase sigma factor (sigma-70 family)
MSSLLTYLRRILDRPGGGTDAELLAHFAERREEAAFEALVQRHGPMVLGVCRRFLPNLPDAEDAFQATFLVLARKAATISRRELVGPWLHAVAWRMARKARADLLRRHAHERQASAMPSPEPSYEMASPGLGPLFDEEVARLPQKYRLPLVLCYLGGKSKEEIAHELGWPEGTVSARLARARAMLRGRLQRRGAALSAGPFATVLAQDSLAATVPPALISATVGAAVLFAAGAEAAEGVASTSAAALAKGAMRSMFLTSLKKVLVALLVIGLAGIGSVAAYHRLAVEPADATLQTGENPNDAPERKPAQPGEQAKDKMKEMKLFVAGAGAPRPGVYALGAKGTYQDALAAAGTDVAKLRGQGLVAYLIQLCPERGGACVAVSGELTKMLNKQNEGFSVVSLEGPGGALPRLTLWIGTPPQWDLFQRSTRQATVIMGANAEQRAAELRKQGVPAKAVTSPEQGQWPPQYDELMRLAEKARDLQKWPGGESWLTSADDEASVRTVVRNFLAAAGKGDEATAARLYPGRSPEGLKSRMAWVKEMATAGGTPGEIRFVAIAQDRALLISEFFAYQEKQQPRGMRCLLYDLRRQKDGWVISDIDLKDVEGMINDVRRFDRRAQAAK